MKVHKQQKVIEDRVQKLSILMGSSDFDPIKWQEYLTKYNNHIEFGNQHQHDLAEKRETQIQNARLIFTNNATVFIEDDIRQQLITVGCYEPDGWYIEFDGKMISLKKIATDYRYNTESIFGTYKEF